MVGAAHEGHDLADTSRPGRFDLDLHRDLRATLDPSELIALLRVRGQMTQVAIATATGVSERTVRSWEVGSEPRRAATDRLHVLAEVVATLTETLTPKGANQWLHAKAAWLDGARPIERLAVGAGPVLDRARLVGEAHHG